jgi:hypothetical protein
VIGFALTLLALVFFGALLISGLASLMIGPKEDRSVYFWDDL